VSTAAVRVGVGTRFLYDGEVVEITEMHASWANLHAVLRNVRTQHVQRMAIGELLDSDHVRILPGDAGPAADDPIDTPGIVLSNLTESDRRTVLERAAHLREVLTGYRSGNAETAIVGEARAQFNPRIPLMRRYEAKAEELGAGLRTLRRWVNGFQQRCEAGLVETVPSASPTGRVDDRWVDTAMEVMVEHTEQSRPTQTMVINRSNARVAARFGDGVVKLPSRATAFRVLDELEKRHPTFRLSTKRNRDIADRPSEAYGKFRPTRTS